MTATIAPTTIRASAFKFSFAIASADGENIHTLENKIFGWRHVDRLLGYCGSLYDGDGKDKKIIATFKDFSSASGPVAEAQRELQKQLHARSVEEAVSTLLLAHLVELNEISPPDAAHYLQQHFGQGPAVAATMLQTAYRT